MSTTFNAPGIPSVDFLEEISDSAVRKKNQLFFALSVRGLAGDPAFGVGLQDMVFEDATDEVGDAIQELCSDRIPDLVDGVTFQDAIVTAYPEEKLLGVSVVITDSETGETLALPVGIGQ